MKRDLINQLHNLITEKTGKEITLHRDGSWKVECDGKVGQDHDLVAALWELWSQIKSKQ